MKTTKTVLAISMLMGLAISSNAEVIIVDEFTTDTMINDTRLRIDDLDDGWLSSAAGGWSITAGAAGVLTNPGTVTNAVSSEGGVGQVVSTAGLSAANTQIAVSFDYTLAAGATLKFYLEGITENVTPAANEILANPGALNGNAQIFKSEVDYAGMDLLNGLEPTDGVAATLTGNGTYSALIDLTGYSWDDQDPEAGVSGSIANVTDFEAIVAFFGANVTVNGAAMSIDNFSVTAIPEPATLGLVIGAGASLLLMRRRLVK